jgi:large subunit ribosomal protein L4
MKINVYNLEGKEVGTALLPKEIFEVKFNADLVHQAMITQTSNRRQVSASTKDRGQVSGGGKKPWRQKGTGRARVGSSRSPLWKGGGVTFGPTTAKAFKKDMNKKARRKALFMVLSSKASDNSLIILEELKLAEPKTKLMANILAKLPSKGKSALLALASFDKNLIRATRNINKVNVMQAKELNVLDLLNSHFLIMPKDSIKTIKDAFLK